MDVGSEEFVRLGSLHAAYLSKGRQLADFSDEEGRLTLGETRIQPAVFAGLDLTSCVMSGCDLSSSTFLNCTFVAAWMNGCRFRACTFIQCSFHNAELNRADFSWSEHFNSNLRKVEIAFADFRRARLIGGDLSWTHLIGTDFRGGLLSDVQFDGVYLHKAIFSSAEALRLKGLRHVRVDGIHLGDDATGPLHYGLNALRIVQG